MKDASAVLKLLPSIDPDEIVTNGTITGASVDTLGFGSATAVIDVGLWTDGTHTFEYQSAPDDGTGAPGTYVAVPAADLVGTEPVILDATNDESQFKLGYIGKDRWVRVELVTTGATTGLAEVVASIVRTNPAAAPVA